MIDENLNTFALLAKISDKTGSREGMVSCLHKTRTFSYSSSAELKKDRAMLDGTIEIGGQEWSVSEEKRGGPQTQLLLLVAKNTPGAAMQIRLGAGHEARSLEEVELYAANPNIRWFTDQTGLRWETRIVVQSEPKGPDRELVKFISDTRDVREGNYGFADGLGRRSDDELRALLDAAPSD